MPNRHGAQPLIFAVRLGNLEACEVLLQQGANPSVQEALEERWTALHYAIYREKLEIFRLLLR